MGEQGMPLKGGSSIFFFFFFFLTVKQRTLSLDILTDEAVLWSQIELDKKKKKLIWCKGLHLQRWDTFADWLRILSQKAFFIQELAIPSVVCWLEKPVVEDVFKALIESTEDPLLGHPHGGVWVEPHAFLSLLFREREEKKGEVRTTTETNSIWFFCHIYNISTCYGKYLGKLSVLFLTNIKHIE